MTELSVQTDQVYSGRAAERPNERGSFVRTLRFLFLVASVCCCFKQISLAEDDGYRIVKERPTGHCVEIESGFMIPYKVTIPGTDIEFEMMPIKSVGGGPAVEPFWIGKHEVTLREYAEFAKLTRVFNELQKKGVRPIKTVKSAQVLDAVTAPTEVYDPAWRFEAAESLDCPAYSMTLYAAKQYTKWLSLITEKPFRLPSEAEWISAARVGRSNWKEFREHPENFAVFGNELGQVQPVGSRKPTESGIYDIWGNASEWVITQFPEPVPAQGEKSFDLTEWPPVWISRGGNYATSASEFFHDDRQAASYEYWCEEANVPLSSTWLGCHDPKVCIGFRLVSPLGPLEKDKMGVWWDAQTSELRYAIDQQLQAGRARAGLIDSEFLKISVKYPSANKQWRLPDVKDEAARSPEK